MTNRAEINPDIHWLGTVAGKGIILTHGESNHYYYSSKMGEWQVLDLPVMFKEGVFIGPGAMTCSMFQVKKALLHRRTA